MRNFFKQIYWNLYYKYTEFPHPEETLRDLTELRKKKKISDNSYEVANAYTYHPHIEDLSLSFGVSRERIRQVLGKVRRLHKSHKA